MKPTIEYLDSLNEYRKRSRSRDDVGTGASTPKMSRIDDHASAVETESALYTNGVEAEGPLQTNGVAVEDDPMVYGTSCPPRSCLGCSQRSDGFSQRGASAAFAGHGGASGGDDDRRVHGVLRGAECVVVVAVRVGVQVYGERWVMSNGHLHACTSRDVPLV